MVAGAMLAACLATAALLAPQGPGACAVSVHNPTPVMRWGVATAPVPLPQGAFVAPVDETTVTVATEAGVELPAVVAWRWPDGSPGLLHAHLPYRVAAEAALTQRLHPVLTGDGAIQSWRPFHHASLLEQPLSLWTELTDPWGRILTAQLVPDTTAGRDGVIVDTGFVRIRRFADRHRLGGPAGAPLLGLTAYLQTTHQDRRGTLTLLLDNRDGGGPVRFSGFAVLTGDDDLRFLPAFAAEQGLEPAEPRPGGGFRQWLLRPDAPHYLGHHTAKTFRLHLFQDGPEVAEADRGAVAWDAHPLAVCPDLDAVRSSGAWSAHGGPAPAIPGDGTAGVHYRQWRQGARFGPFAGFGDPENAGVQGTARNGPSALHNLLRWCSPHLFLAAEGMFLQQTLRPTPATLPLRTEDQRPYQQGLGPLARHAPHGFTAPDYEHCSVLLLYDWWWLTGDPLAREELARVGRGLRRELSALPFLTSRGEGWCLQSGVLIARATGDRELLGWLHRRWQTVVLPQLGPPGASYALRQPPHPDAMAGEPFDAPWQMAALLHGLHALWRATGDGEVRAAMLRVADLICGPGWLEGRGPKQFVSALDAGRYAITADPGVAAGLARMVAAGLVLAVAAAGDDPAADRPRARLRELLRTMVPADAPPDVRAALHANPWLQIVLDREAAR